MSTELYRRYRPKTLDEIVGQKEAVAQIRNLLERKQLPHVILLTGPSGTGKTTIGRILRRALKCHKNDYYEKDCTIEAEPLKYVRELGRNTKLAPMFGPCSVHFLEEVQSLSRAGFSQQAMLKLFEDCPKHVYFIMATTDPDKLHKAIRSRATEIRLGPVRPEPMELMLRRVIDAEKMKVDDEVIASIIEVADGGMRKALVILEQVGGLNGKEEQLKGVEKASAAKDEAYKLGVELLYRPTNWPTVAKILRDVAGEEPEGLRHMILTMAKNCLIGTDCKPPNIKNADRAYRVIDIFSRNFFDSKHAGLAAACWEVLNPEE